MFLVPTAFRFSYRARWAGKTTKREGGGDLALTSVIGAGGRSWLRFPRIRNYPKVFYSRSDPPPLSPICPTFPPICDLSRVNESSHPIVKVSSTNSKFVRGGDRR